MSKVSRRWRKKCSNVMASDAWQSAMAARRSEICDPVLVATVEERFKGITLLSLERLKQKLEAPQDTFEGAAAKPFITLSCLFIFS